MHCLPLSAIVFMGEYMKDPICGMEVGKDSKFKSNYKGKDYYFCSASCKQSFDKSPEKHVKG